MSNTYHQQQPISHAFLSYGTAGIGVHRAEELRAAEQERMTRAARPTRGGGLIARTRRKLGGLLITTGERALGEPAVKPSPVS